VTLLAARGVSRAYGRRVALRPTDLTLVEGEVVALVGPNGAGKSTLLAILAGALAPTAGTVERHAAVGWVPQRSAHYARLTSRENLVLFAALEHADASRVEQLLGEFELPEDVRAGELSVGNRQRLDVALALLASPRVLLLDEPTASLDPDTGDWVRAYLERYRDREGAAILLASHNMGEVERLCSEVLMMRRGQIVDRGAPAELVARYGRSNLEEVFLDIARERRQRTPEGEAARELESRSAGLEEHEP
jgi:ABC-2 type transport system ATP-binding protein